VQYMQIDAATCWFQGIDGAVELSKFFSMVVLMSLCASE
jgi:hypothetical protein